MASLRRRDFEDRLREALALQGVELVTAEIYRGTDSFGWKVCLFDRHRVVRRMQAKIDDGADPYSEEMVEELLGRILTPLDDEDYE